MVAEEFVMSNNTPGLLGTAGPSRLMVDLGDWVAIMNCQGSLYGQSYSGPKVSHNPINDMSYIRYNGKEILIVAGPIARSDLKNLFSLERKQNILIYELKNTGGSSITHINWAGYEDSREINAAGVVADSYGHLFISDRNAKCLHEVSLSDYSYQGSFDFPNDMGTLGTLGWCEASRSVLVFHWDHSDCRIAKIRVNP